MMRFIKTIFLLIQLIFVIPTMSSELKQDLPLVLKKLIKRHLVKNSLISLKLIDVESKQSLQSYNSNIPVIPASLTKILTSYYALSILGGNYRFNTKVVYSGVIEESKILGDLYLIGTGDPLLTSSTLMNLVLELKSRGIKSITGNFYYIAQKGTEIQKISSLGLGDQTYNPAVTSLSIDFNRFSIINTKSKQSYTIPDLNHIKITQSKKRLGPGVRYNYKKNLNGQKTPIEQWEFDSRKKYKYLEELPVRNPSFYTAQLFKFLAKKLSIELPSPKNIKRSEYNKLSLLPLKTQYSLSSFKIASLAMEYSNNLLAEQLMLKASRKTKNQPLLNYKDSMEVMNQWLKDNSKGFWDQSLNLENASGLSANNFITSQYLTKFISETLYTKFSHQYFWTIYSLAGNSGWLKKRLKSHKAAYNIWAKTGSLDYVNNIAGILTTKTGKTLAFSILINDLKKRERLNGKNSYKLKKLRSAAPKWKKKSKILANKILDYWLTKY